MSERTDDTTHEDYRWTDHEREVHYNNQSMYDAIQPSPRVQTSANEQARPQPTPAPNTPYVWSAIDPTDRSDPHFAFNGKFYVKRNGKLHEGSEHQGGDFSLTELSPEDEKRVEYDYSQHVYEQSPKEPGLQDTFNPAEPWGAGVARGPIVKRLQRVGAKHVTDLLKDGFPN